MADQPEYTVKRLTPKTLTPERLDRLVTLFRALDDAENGYDAAYGLKLRKPSDNGIRKWLLHRKDGIYAAAGKNGKILGFSVSNPAQDYARANYISTLSVDPAFRGRGIGRAVLEKIVRDNRSKKRRSLLHVSLNNPAGLHLYGSLGFKPIGQTMVLDEGQEKTAGFVDDLRDIASNTSDAVRSGQIPIPGMTIAGKHENAPLDVKPGEPVYYGMTGAGPWSDLPQMSGSNTRYTTPKALSFETSARVPGMRPGNTRMYRWFDRAQMARDLLSFIRSHPKNPVYAFGHSYGGAAISDVVNRLGTNRVHGLVMYDPVARNPGKAPATVRGKAVSIYPKYKHALEPGNLVADVGGRIPAFDGAETMHTSGSHVIAAPAIGQELQRLIAGHKRKEPTTIVVR